MAVTVRVRAVVVATLVGASLAVAGPVPAAAPPAQPPARPLDTAAAVAPPQRSVGPTPEQAVRPGEVLVRFRSTAAPSVRAAALRRHAGPLAASAPEATAIGGGVHRLRVARGAERAVAAGLARDPSVVYAEPNFIRTGFTHSDNETIPWGVRAVAAPSVWPKATGADVRVAVVDSGVNPAGDHFARVVRGEDVYDVTGDGTADDCGHGTAVAGVIAAKHDERSIVGVAYDATIVPVKVLYHDTSFGACVGDDAAIVRGIRWAAKASGGNADVINLSLGGPGYSRTLADAIDEAVAQGVIIVAASGNTGDRNPSYPAALPGVISVGGLRRTSDGDVAWWSPSTFGSVDIAAPAAHIRVIRAEGVARGLIGYSCGPQGGLCTDGTSFAAPHVAGVAALLLEEHPEAAAWSPGSRVRRVRQWLLGTAVAVPAGTSRVVDLQTGHGRVDAFRSRRDSLNPDATLLTWMAKRRVISPTSAILSTPTAATVSAFVSTGPGTPKSGTVVAFSTGRTGRTSYTSASTDSTGRARTSFRSTAAGTTTRLAVTAAGRRLPLEMYVLQRDDNIRGVRPPGTVQYGRLDAAYDSDDVYRFGMREGERLRATLTGVGGYEYIDMWLFRPTARDVTTGASPPLREDSDVYEFDPLRLSRRVPADGTYYLDLFGAGTYRLAWHIVWPDRIAGLKARPATFSPDGDGDADTTLLSWRLRTRGRVTVQIRDSSGRVRKSRDFGWEPADIRTWRWGGTDSSGDRLPDGRYTVGVRWSNAAGRVSSSSVRVTIDR